MLSSSQRKLPPFQNVQTPPSPSISSSYYIPQNTFSGHELPIPFPPTHLNNTTSQLTNIALLRPQDSTFPGTGQYHPVKDNIFMFGSEASCSSSDGSGGGGSQISFGREIKQEEMGNFQGYSIHTGYEENNKFLMGYGGSNGNQWPEKGNGCFGESPLDYHQYSLVDEEDVKQQQLMSRCSNGFGGCSSSSGFFNIDENKTEEKVMYYY